MTSLAILDPGYGNTESIRLAFARLGADAILTSEPAEVEAAEHLVLPGVGAAGFAMERLRDCDLIDPLRRRSKPLLGICLGMQLMFDWSDEGEVDCLGLLPGAVRALAPSPGYPIPHMGWSRLQDCAPALGIADDDYAFFAHGLACSHGPATAASVLFGDALITAAVRSGNLWGAQFHPERSSTAGSRFLRAFLAA